MIDETMAKIEEAIRRSADADPRHKGELVALFEKLKKEIQELPATHDEQARSIAGFAAVAAHEAARKKRSAELLKLSLGGLSASVSGFEASHPRLSAVVNEICTLLAGLGI